MNEEPKCECCSKPYDEQMKCKYAHEHYHSDRIYCMKEVEKSTAREVNRIMILIEINYKTVKVEISPGRPMTTEEVLKAISDRVVGVIEGANRNKKP